MSGYTPNGPFNFMDTEYSQYVDPNDIENDFSQLINLQSYGGVESYGTELVPGFDFTRTQQQAESGQNYESYFSHNSSAGAHATPVYNQTYHNGLSGDLMQLCDPYLGAAADPYGMNQSALTIDPSQLMTSQYSFLGDDALTTVSNTSLPQSSYAPAPPVPTYSTSASAMGPAGANTIPLQAGSPRVATSPYTTSTGRSRGSAEPACHSGVWTKTLPKTRLHRSSSPDIDMRGDRLSRVEDLQRPTKAKNWSKDEHLVLLDIVQKHHAESKQHKGRRHKRQHLAWKDIHQEWLAASINAFPRSEAECHSHYRLYKQRHKEEFPSVPQRRMWITEHAEYMCRLPDLYRTLARGQVDWQKVKEACDIKFPGEFPWTRSDCCKKYHDKLKRLRRYDPSVGASIDSGPRLDRLRW